MSEESSEISAKDVWSLDLPPGADPFGSFPLETGCLPEHLQPVCKQILEGVADKGRKLFILLRQGGDESTDDKWEDEADLAQLALRLG